MQKRKKRFKPLSKLQKGILFFFVLVAVSLIVVILAVVGGVNPFVFVFPSKKENSMRLMPGMSFNDTFINGEDLTENLNNPKCLIARNGATKSPDKKKNEAYVSQFLHRLFLKNDINVSSLDSKIKTQANIDVNIKFYLVPTELQNKDPKDFVNNPVEFQKLLDLDNYPYSIGEKTNQKFFNSCVVFNNQIYENSTKKYEYSWLGHNFEYSVYVQPIVGIGLNNKSEYYYPKNEMFSSQELKNSIFLGQEINKNFNKFELDSTVKSSSSEKLIKPKQNISVVNNIPTPEHIESTYKNENKKNYKIYQPNKNEYPKLIDKKKNENVYEALETLILINFWNEMSLCEEFFEEVELKESTTETIKNKSYYTNGRDDYPLTLFTQITYTLVDNEGKTHTLATNAQGPNLTDIQHSNSTADKGGSGQKRIKVTRREDIKNTSETKITV